MTQYSPVPTITRIYSRVQDRYYPWLKPAKSVFLQLWDDTRARLAILYLVILVLVAAIGPSILPYEYNEFIYRGGELYRNQPPSLQHPLGTDTMGRDLFTRLVYGTRPTLITGFVGGGILITIGTSIGVTSGYIGGKVESVLMRITDFAFAVPALPFGIVLVGLINVGYYTAIVVIGILLWRTSARVIRSQTLQIKEQEFITAIEAEGASRPYIMFRHILPNIAPIAMLYFALGIGYAILLQAGLVFIGVLTPFVPSWGVMIRNAFGAGQADIWWWSLPPGLMLSMTVLAAFLIGRRYEDLTGNQSEQLMVDAE